MEGVQLYEYISADERHIKFPSGAHLLVNQGDVVGFTVNRAQDIELADAMGAFIPIAKNAPNYAKLVAAVINNKEAITATTGNQVSNAATKLYQAEKKISSLEAEVASLTETRDLYLANLTEVAAVKAGRMKDFAKRVKASAFPTEYKWYVSQSDNVRILGDDKVNELVADLQVDNKLLQIMLEDYGKALMLATEKSPMVLTVTGANSLGVSADQLHRAGIFAELQRKQNALEAESEMLAEEQSEDVPSAQAPKSGLDAPDFEKDVKKVKHSKKKE